VADLKRTNSPQDDSAVADLRRKWSTILKAAPVPTKTAAAFQQSAVTLDRVAAFCFTRNAHHSLNSLASGMVNQAP
jgi:hypothetical protein